MLFMLWALAGSGHRQAHGTNDVPWLPASPTSLFAARAVAIRAVVAAVPAMVHAARHRARPVAPRSRPNSGWRRDRNAG